MVCFLFLKFDLTVGKRRRKSEGSIKQSTECLTCLWLVVILPLLCNTCYYPWNVWGINMATGIVMQDFIKSEVWRLLLWVYLYLFVFTCGVELFVLHPLIWFNGYFPTPIVESDYYQLILWGNCFVYCSFSHVLGPRTSRAVFVFVLG